ncbi:MAG: FliM/FliN family flagellar motor switch protein [Rickettsiaceae bacterium]
MSKNSIKNNNSPNNHESVGINAVLDQALQTYERLPMLEVLMEKFVQKFSISLRNLITEPADIHLKEFSSLRFHDYFSNIDKSSTIGIFKSLELENLGMLVFDSKMVFLFINILLGGKKNLHSHSNSIDAKKLTSIEQELVKQLSEILLHELSLAFEQISTSTFVLDRIETNANFANIIRLGEAVILFKISVEIDNRVGYIDLIIPYNTIEPIKEKLQKVFLGDKVGSDVVWEDMINKAVENVDVSVEAVIINNPTSLKNVAKLKTGDTIMINHNVNDDIDLRVGGETENPVNILKGQLGKANDCVSIKLTNIINK